MEWVKTRVYQTESELRVHRLRSDGAILHLQSSDMSKIAAMSARLLADKSPWTGRTEQVFDEDFERQMRENGGKETLQILE